MVGSAVLAATDGGYRGRRAREGAEEGCRRGRGDRGARGSEGLEGAIKGAVVGGAAGALKNLAPEGEEEG